MPSPLRPYLSTHCSPAGGQHHHTCMRIYGGKVCACVCHENPAYEVSTAPIFETVAAGTYDGETDDLDLTFVERSAIDALANVGARRIFTVACSSRLDGATVETCETIAALDVANEAAYRLLSLLLQGHREITVRIEEQEQPF